jgi:hypothetical protein
MKWDLKLKLMKSDFIRGNKPSFFKKRGFFSELEGTYLTNGIYTSGPNLTGFQNLSGFYRSIFFSR